MPLNVPVTLTVSPVDRQLTVHTDRQRWSTEQLAAVPDGRAALETAVREGVRKAASACAYAQLTAPDIAAALHPDGSLTMTGRVLCDEPDCHTAAQSHHFDAAEAIEARAAAEWVAQKELDFAPGELEVVREHVRAGRRREPRRASLGLMLTGLLCVAGGVSMSRYDYHRPESASTTSLMVWLGENFDAICSHFASPWPTQGSSSPSTASSASSLPSDQSSPKRPRCPRHIRSAAPELAFTSAFSSRAGSCRTARSAART
ncbi:hypothetical protein [Streptomyces parvulus]